MRVKASQIKIGDVLASGEIVKSHRLLVNRGRIIGVHVTLSNPLKNKERTGRWHARTLIACRELA